MDRHTTADILSTENEIDKQQAHPPFKENLLIALGSRQLSVRRVLCASVITSLMLVVVISKLHVVNNYTQLIVSAIVAVFASISALAVCLKLQTYLAKLDNPKSIDAARESTQLLCLFLLLIATLGYIGIQASL